MAAVDLYHHLRRARCVHILQGAENSLRQRGMLLIAGGDDKAADDKQGEQDQLHVTSLLEDYFKLDYEEKVAGIACRSGFEAS